MANVKYNIQSDFISISEGIQNQSQVVHSSPSDDDGQVRTEKRTRSTKNYALFESFRQKIRNNSVMSIIIRIE